MPTMTVDTAELAEIVGENAVLKKRVDELLESNTRYLEERRLDAAGPVLGQAAAHYEGRKAGLREAATLLLVHADECERLMSGGRSAPVGIGKMLFGVSASVALRITAVELAKRAGDADLEKLASKGTT